jgi:F-type H+-transporting ATPase subunit epsilon
MPMHVELVSPEAIVFTGDADMVLARTSDGDIAFQPGHVPFIGTLSGKGPVKVWLRDGTVMLVAVHSGFVQVANDTVTVLSDIAELAGSIDVGRAEAARDQALADLSAAPDDEDAKARLTRAELRLAVAGGNPLASHARH